MNAFQSNPFTIPTSRQYNGSRIFTTVTNVLRWRQEATGTMTSFELWTPTNDGPQSAIFNLRQNGVGIWSGAQRPTIAAGGSSASKTGLNVPVTLGDLMELSVEQCPTSGIGAVIEFIQRTQIG